MVHSHQTSTSPPPPPTRNAPWCHLSCSSNRNSNSSTTCAGRIINTRNLLLCINPSCSCTSCCCCSSCIQILLFHQRVSVPCILLRRAFRQPKFSLGRFAAEVPAADAAEAASAASTSTNFGVFVFILSFLSCL